MAISLSFFPICTALLLAIFSRITQAETRTYDFNVTWVTAAPDGFDRPVIGVNGQWPWPTIYATKGDRVVVNTLNQLGNQTVTIHFHGLFQNGTVDMDGPYQVTQCGIEPNGSYTYNFTIEQPGTYWYHSHAHGQYPDGMRAPLIVEDPDNPFKDQYDEEIILSVSDWYHEQMANLIPAFMSRTNPTGAEPVPDSALLNDTTNLTIPVEPGKTYLFRMVNVGAFAGQYIWFENHTMTIVEVDGVYSQPAEADTIYLSAAQRTSFLLTTKNDTSQNYAFVGSMDTSLFDTIPDGFNWNATGWLVYNENNTNPEAQIILEDDFNEFDDATLVAYDGEPLWENPTQTIEMVLDMNNLGDGANYAFFDNITYVSPKVPTLYTLLSSGENATNPAIYGEYSHPFVLEHNQVVEIIINNADSGKHPLHLHGHHFQVLSRSDEEAGDFNASDPTMATFPEIPIRRDTLVVNGASNFVIRFRSDNPGVWLFHCHIEWHMDSGLIATMVEAPLELQASGFAIPQAQYDLCSLSDTPITGNAAGNTVDLFDLTGQNAPPAPLPDGFTTRGKVALAFSILSALIGLGVIAYYGLADMGAWEKENEKRRLAEEAAARQNQQHVPI